ncbi:MAG: winged helix-turn-helix domain-containing protein, partial [Acidimicrobiia bacterium]|nr:winged helix-turn-helix domain-containing protein [Acidimicrobiia bacterium]
MARTGQWNMSADVARRVALGAQGFADPRPSGKIDRRHLRRVMRRMQVVQLDSVPVVIRTQYMPFHSRLRPYRTGLLDEIAYRHDEWYEAWSHEASLLPVQTEPQFRWMRDRAREGKTWKPLAEMAKKEANYVQAVLDEVRERKHVAGGELSDPRPVEGTNEGWWHRSVGVLALDWLFRVGELGVRRRGNFEKVFSPFEDIVPEDVLATPTPSVDGAQRELTRQALAGLGVGTVSDVADYFRLPVREIRVRLGELVESGEAVPASVKGWDKPAYADASASIPRSIRGATVLSPFDPVVWCRERAERLFDFAYKIEIYVPAAKRRYGYYVLPVMIDGH